MWHRIRRWMPYTQNKYRTSNRWCVNPCDEIRTIPSYSILLHAVRVHGSTFPVLPPPLGHMTQLVHPLLTVPYSFATLAMRK